MTDVKRWPVPDVCHACGQKTVKSHCGDAKGANCVWVTCNRQECKAVSAFVIDQSKPKQVPPAYKPVFIYAKAA